MTNLQDMFDANTTRKGYWKHRPEARAKIAAANRNKSPEARAKLGLASSRYHTGKKRSEETRKKMSAARKGRMLSEETRKKISAAKKGRPATNRGVPQSEETRKKISANNKKSRPMMTPQGIFPSAAEAARALGIGRNNLYYWIEVSKKSEYYYLD